jgi:hypothetical protein
MKVIVGSSDLELTTEIINVVAAAFGDPDEPFGIRVPHGQEHPVTPVENLVEAVAERLGRRVIRFRPTKGGRAAVYHRDYDLVTDASEVIAFFSTEREMDGGTGHVVKAALDREVPVEAYTSHPDGTLVLLGSDPGTDASTNKVLYQMYEEAQGA